MSTSELAAPKRNWLSWFQRRPRDRDRLLPLYEAIVATGRDPFWYRDGKVPDTVDGRFDMIASVLSLVLIRMEGMAEEEAKPDSVLLTETFIEDMDQSLRQAGIGDYVVGKHVGRMVGALGGRLGAFRDAVAGGAFEPPVRRNIFHDDPPSDEAVALVADRLARSFAALEALTLDDLIAGRVPRP